VAVCTTLWNGGQSDSLRRVISSVYRGDVALAAYINFAVTNKRVILKTGVISRRVLDLVLAKCEGLQIKQSVLGRIFNFVTITITTGGDTSSYPFIAAPQRFKKEINQQIG